MIGISSDLSIRQAFTDPVYEAYTVSEQEEKEVQFVAMLKHILGLELGRGH